MYRMRSSSHTLRALFCAVLLLACSALAHAAAKVGEPAPPLALLDSTGELVSIENLKGRVLYVDFWASWCGPCRQSFPWMNDLRKRFADQGLTIISVNVDKKRVDAERFLRDSPAAFTVLYDAAGATPSTWGARGMPTSFLIDRQGRVVATEVGFSDDRKDAMEARIRELLAAR